MPKNPLVEERLRNKREFLDILRNNPDVPLARLIGAFCNKTGLRAAVVRNYYEELLAEGLVAPHREE